MNELKIGNSMFEDIKHTDEMGNEYWLARELQKVLEYKDWRNFNKVVGKAIISANNSYPNQNYWGVEVTTPISSGKGKIERINDYKLSRYACYLIVQNSDPSKEVVALGQTYFAIQTRRQELSEKVYNSLTEDEKRFYQRDLTRKGNYSLNKAAMNAGVRDFAKFHNAGYKGLYNGETANDIAKRKGLRYREDILDNMGSEELADNLFRIVQTDAKIKREDINTENNACNIHYEIGLGVRKTIEKFGGTMPEDLPTPEKSLKELEKENKLINSNKC